MTTISIKRLNSSSFFLRSTGHTEPTVCAGISAIVQLLAGYCENHREELMDLHIYLSSGESEISFIGDCQAAAVFEAVYIGLKQIELGYPGTVEIFDDDYHR